jgi:hypothetical protein
MAFQETTKYLPKPTKKQQQQHFTLRKEKERKQLWASSLIQSLFSPLYLDTSGGWWCSWCIEFAGEVAFPILCYFSAAPFLGPLMLFFLIV